ncbi:MAG: hypothetical protein HQM14_18450 [SAR324 cluster bacterium]|nr:hypothetical protein [SAR324 cluster bacterium]
MNGKKGIVMKFFQKFVYISLVALLVIGCSSDLKLSVDESVWVGQEIECSVTGTWQEISWYIDNQRVGKCEGQTSCQIPAAKTGKFRIKVEVKNHYKSAFEPAIEEKKEKTVFVAKTDPDLIGKWRIREDLLKNSGENAFTDTLPSALNEDSTFREELEITRDEYIVTKVLHGAVEEKRYTADQDSGNELSIYFNGIFIREETYTLSGDTLTLEHTNSADASVKKVFNMLK